MTKTLSSGQISLQYFLHDFTQFVPRLKSFLSPVLCVKSILGSDVELPTQNTHGKAIVR